ncbi:helix-turn-helix transcriptional regulator [Gammaproteobacteria bacterium]|nr:helix-turn-helix transcriptional regulator [Gammaproteobacteria bacterium]
MSQVPTLIVTLKRQLRARGFTYQQLADELQLSESAVKQMFSNGNMSLTRLDAICSVLGMDMRDLISLLDPNQGRVEQLSREIEQELIADKRLLLVGYCVVNYWTFDDILNHYTLSRSDCIGHLAQLDRMKIIELLPGNRIKPLIASNFRWIPNGPIERYVRHQVEREFLEASFAGDNQSRLFRNGFLSASSQRQLNEKLQQVVDLFDELLTADRRLTRDEKSGATLLLAFRQWGLRAFEELERKEPR